MMGFIKHSAAYRIGLLEKWLGFRLQATNCEGGIKAFRAMARRKSFQNAGQNAGQNADRTD
jgi:hypothetical protein